MCILIYQERSIPLSTSHPHQEKSLLPADCYSIPDVHRMSDYHTMNNNEKEKHFAFAILYLMCKFNLPVVFTSDNSKGHAHAMPKGGLLTDERWSSSVICYMSWILILITALFEYLLYNNNISYHHITVTFELLGFQYLCSYFWHIDHSWSDHHSTCKRIRNFWFFGNKTNGRSCHRTKIFKIFTNQNNVLLVIFAVIQIYFLFQKQLSVLIRTIKKLWFSLMRSLLRYLTYALHCYYILPTTHTHFNLLKYPDNKK